MNNLNYIEELKELVEKIIEYTRNWSISETEWYWNIECVRKPNNIKDEEITWEEFEVAIREETLYDLIFNGGRGIINQMENDYECYTEDDILFKQSSTSLEMEIRKIIKDFKIHRVDTKGQTYFL